MIKLFKKVESLLSLIMVLTLLFSVILFLEPVYATDVTIPTPKITNISIGNVSLAYSDNDNELRIELEETKDDYAIQYEVLYGTSINSTTQMEIVEIEMHTTTTDGTRAYLVSNDALTAGTTYYFKVRRCHGSIKSEWSNIYTYNFVKVGKPVIKSVSVQYKQVHISAPYEYYSVPYLHVSWDATVNAEKYIVEVQRYNEERNTYSQFGYEYAISNTYADVSWYSGDFKPNEKLYISVKAYSESKSSYSEASEKYEIIMPNIVLNKIEFDNYNLSLKVGDKKYIEETLSPYNATNRAVLWTSSNADVATVSSYGQITAVSEGRTIITCSGLYGDAFAVCEVIVTANENSDETSSEVSTGSGKCGDDATWVLDENGVLTISGTGAILDWNSYDSNTKSFFLNCGKYVKKIVIEEGITKVGDSSFSTFPNVTDVILPDSLESMGNGCFYGGGFTDIVIPKNVKTIEPRAFMYCNNLLSIDVANGNQYFFAIDGVLFNASTLTLVSYPKNKQDTNYSVPNGIEHIEGSAFHSVMSLKSVTLPSTIKTIGEVAFGYCKNLTECNIPNGVYNIAASAFNSTGLTELVLPSSLETLTINSFYGCNKLDYIVIPKSITNIDAAVFQKCDNITHINYEGSQSEWNEIVIGANNDSLTNATINFNSTHVHSGGSATCSARAVCEECGNEYGAFAHSLSYYDYKSATCKEVGWQSYEKCSNCSYSTYIEIPRSSHNIGKYGAYPATCEAEGNITYYKCSVCEQFFSDSNGENTISQADTITSPIGHSYNENTGLCTNCDKVKPGYCGANITWELNENGVLTINGIGEMWKNFSWEPTEIKEVIINNGVTNISAKAFRGCTNLTNISIPDSIVSIGANSFYGTPLKSITIPNSVETLEKNALYGCNSLEELTVPFIGGSQNSNTILGHIFSSTTSSSSSSSGAILYKTTYHIPTTLKKVIITNETTITSSSFKNCSNIEVIVLPSTLVSIDSTAFKDCSKLTDIYFTGTNVEWESLFPGELTATIHFSDVTATSIALDKTEVLLLEGDSETLSATIIPGNVTNKNVIWSSSNENVATVSNGVITAKKVGTTTITATSGDGKQTATCVVTVDYKVKISVFDYQVIGTYVLIDLSVENMTDTATLYFVTYDESGRMLEIQAPTLTDGSTRIILPLGTIHKIKAFVWKDNLQPITRYVEKVL